MTRSSASVNRTPDLPLSKPPGQPGGRGTRTAPCFPRWSQSSDSKIGNVVASLPGAWRYRVIVRTGWQDVSTRGLDEIASCISVKKHVQTSKHVRSRDTLSCCWYVKQAASTQTKLSVKDCCHLFVTKKSVFISVKQTRHQRQPPRWPCGKSSVSRAGGMRIVSRSSYTSDF